jgi:hypothetical protein
MHALQSVSRFVGGNERRRAVYVTLYNYNVLDKKQKVNVVVIRSLSLSVYTIRLFPTASKPISSLHPSVEEAV